MVESPCNLDCCIEDGICVGCYRTKDEVQLWPKADDEQKLQILKRVEERKNENQH